MVGTGELYVVVERIYPWPCWFSLHIGFILCALSSSRVFLGSRISIFYGFSDLPRAPETFLCDHGLLRQRVNVRTTTTGYLPEHWIPGHDRISGSYNISNA